MRLKQKIALLLSGVMLAGAIGVINPVEVKAIARQNTFTLTVPANTNIESSGWNDIGKVKVTGNIETSKKVTVAITTANGSKLKSGSNVVSYTIKKSSDDPTALSSIDFAASDVNKSEGASQAIGAVVDATQFANAVAGTYEDTITFTAKVKPAVSIVYSKENKNIYDAVGKLLSDDLGTPTTWEYNGTTYQVYNEFIPFTKYTSWNDATGFVKALNIENYDGHNDWTLLSSKEMATAWYNQYKTSVNRGDVGYLWSSKDAGSTGNFLDCSNGSWGGDSDKSFTKYSYGFVVLRGSESSESTGVEYTLTGKNAGGKKLTSADLLASKTADASTYSTFTYDSTTYTAYNGYISATAYANWDDAQAFVQALNTAAVDECTSWTLLTDKDMAYAWWLSTNPNKEKFGLEYIDGVSGVWTSADSDSNGYAWICDVAREKADEGKPADEVKSNAWNWPSKNTSESELGFVVLRESSSDSGEDPEEVTMENASSNTLSSADLGDPSNAFSVGEGGDEKWYVAYNGFISSTSGSNWQDAQDFVAALNDAGYGGYNDWQLLGSEEMAKAWYKEFVSDQSLDLGNMWYLWSSVGHQSVTNYAFLLRCTNGNWTTTTKAIVHTAYGFVVLRGSSSPE